MESDTNKKVLVAQLDVMSNTATHSMESESGRLVLQGNRFWRSVVHWSGLRLPCICLYQGTLGCHCSVGKEGGSVCVGDVMQCVLGSERKL